MSARVFALAAALLALSAGAAFAADAPRAPGYRTPHTPWGDPDFQGLWASRR
jgi:hypothetical protein